MAIAERQLFQKKINYCPNFLTFTSPHSPNTQHMLGHLRPSLCQLNTADKAQYQNLYCSICASLRQQHSLPYSLFINNELTLVLLALRPYYETQSGTTPCPAALFTHKNPMSSHSAIDTAANLSVLLGWIKLTDTETDQPKFYKTLLRKALQGKIDQLLPHLSPDFQKILEQYLWLTKTNSKDEQAVRYHSGLLSQYAVLEIGKSTNISPIKLYPIADLFQYCGQLIATADHLIDIDDDLLQGQYNPIVETSKQRQIPLSEAYYQFLLQSNRLQIVVRDIARQLAKNGVIKAPFVSALQQSLKKIASDIRQKRPDFIATADLPISPDFVIARSDCSAIGTESCQCAQNSLEGASGIQVMAGQCPCGQCCNGCDQCCKGCGDGCSGCSKGCNDCCGNCNRCCSSCDDCCSACKNTTKPCKDACSSCNRCCDASEDCCQACNCDTGNSNSGGEPYMSDAPTETYTSQYDTVSVRTLLDKTTELTEADFQMLEHYLDSIKERSIVQYDMEMRNLEYTSEHFPEAVKERVEIIRKHYLK